MHLYESKLYTYISVVNKSTAWNSNRNHSGKRKNLEKWPQKSDDDVNNKG